MKKKIIIFILAISMLMPANSLAVDNKSLQEKSKDTDLILFIETFQFIKDNYPFEIEEKDLIEGGLKGMFQTLDPYSDYYTPEEAEEVYKSMLGTFSGIGVYIEEKDSYINIKDTIKDAPGEKAGLKKNDIIVSIDGTDTKGMSLKNIQNMIQGLIGTKVKLGIKRENKTLPIYIEITRERIVINPVEHEVLEDDIGYIKLKEFSQYATIEVNKALDDFTKEGVSKIILDLRDNPGGLLNQAIDISKIFVKEGPVVHIKEKNKPLVTHISTNKTLKYKLVVLINENSASASEIFAGAVKDTKSGYLIGQKTFGKGIVQAMIPLRNGSIIKMTTSEYLTPNKISIHGIGIMPDKVVENSGTVDLQLKEAVNQLRTRN